MASLGYQNISSEYTTEDKFGLIPKGPQPMQVIATDVKIDRNGYEYHTLQFQIIEGQYENRRIFMNYHVHNGNEKTATIARQQLVTIGNAIGVFDFEDSEDLLNRPFIGTIGINEKNTNKHGQIEPSNVISYAKPYVNGASMKPAMQRTPDRNERAAPLSQRSTVAASASTSRQAAPQNGAGAGVKSSTQQNTQGKRSTPFDAPFNR